MTDPSQNAASRAAPAGRPSDATAAPGWHAQPIEQVLKALDASPRGLTGSDAAERLRRQGPNRLPAVRPRSRLARLLAQINNVLIWLLLVSAATAWFLGHGIDASVIVAVVVINAIVGYVQEGKAEEALGAIRNLIAPRANLLRDGHRVSVDAAGIVAGDMVVLEAGDRVPADLRLVRARGLAIDESLLTGESVPADKHEGAVSGDAPLGDRFCMCFSGTLVTTGQGTGVVVATGTGTEIGKISTLLHEVQPLTTPLLRQINRFGHWLTGIIVAISVLVFLFAHLIRNMGWADALMSVVGMAVAAIPEGLPAVMTITLAVGVQRMARRNAIIRQLPAVETLGATSVICSDKTGTLTRNEMMAARLVTAAGRIEASGSGYDPAGTLSLDGKTITADRTMPANDLIRTGLLCNDARLAEHDGRWQVVGDPMEGALIALAIKSGLDIEAARQAWTRLDEIPFDSQHRFMATLNRGGDGRSVIHVKGAPEKLLSLCAAEARPEGTAALDHERWTRAIAQAAAEGQRVLGFAVKPLAAAPQRLAPGHVEGALFLGIVGFIDPPREEAIAAVAECRSAGIAVKMITGDHAATALAIAGQLRLADKPEALLGAELDRVGPRELPALARRATVFARTSPEHKLRIVQALQSAGDVVAMTGDGVNDAPSLKQADIGIAMGRKGTEAAKEAAEMVLADDNFASIVAAVREGRTVYDNLRKVIAWTLPTNGGEAMVIVSAILLGFSLPLTPAQVLWINMLTAVTLGLVLAFEPAEPDIMQRPPRGRHNALLSPFLVWRVIFVSLLFTVASFSIFDLAIARGLGLEGARTMVVNTIVVLEIFYLFNVRYLTGASITWRGVLGTRPVLISLATVIAAQAAFTYLPPMQRLFSSRPLSVADGAIVMAAGILLMAVLEIEKALLVRLGLFQTGLGMPPRRAGPPDGPQPEPGP